MNHFTILKRAMRTQIRNNFQMFDKDKHTEESNNNFQVQNIKCNARVFQFLHFVNGKVYKIRKKISGLTCSGCFYGLITAKHLITLFSQSCHAFHQTAIIFSLSSSHLAKFCVTIEIFLVLYRTSNSPVSSLTV